MQRLAPMSQLSARLFAALLAQGLRLALEVVAARRLAAVVAIFGQPRFQVLHTHQQRQVLLVQALNLGFELGNPLVGPHGSMLHLHRKSA